jgi:signal transduction histidine kinase
MAATLAQQHEREAAFLASVAHDLRTPLTVLKLQVDGIHSNQPLPPEPRLRRVLETARRELARLERMLGDLLDTTKIEAGVLELIPVECDLRALVQSTVSLFRPTAADHEIQVSLPALPVTIHADPLRVEQVVANLLSNAIKYSPRGGRVDIELRQVEDAAMLTVSDQGIGIADEDQRLLFEPFRRLGLSGESIPGAGLGLFVVRRIVEAHGGRIDVTSAPQHGSTFRITLPLSPTFALVTVGRGAGETASSPRDDGTVAPERRFPG